MMLRSKRCHIYMLSLKSGAKVQLFFELTKFFNSFLVYMEIF